MSKTLTAVLVFCVVLLVASPAQAEPVIERAGRAALCYATYLLANEATTQPEGQEIFDLALNKCRAVIIKHALWLVEQYPSRIKNGKVTVPRKRLRASEEDLFFRLERAYGVTTKQITREGLVLGLWSND